jgi:hypothetical protein
LFDDLLTLRNNLLFYLFSSPKFRRSEALGIWGIAQHPTAKRREPGGGVLRNIATSIKKRNILFRFLIKSVTFVFTPGAYFSSSRRLGDWLYGFPVLSAGYGCAFPWTGAFVFSFLGLVPWILLLIE